MAERPEGSPAPRGLAARLHGPSDVRLADEPVPVPGPGEELVAVTAVGLCGSDRHWYLEGGIGDTVLAGPLVLGHEFAGVIAGGPRDGERVAVDPAQPCGRCALCRGGRGRLCEAMRFLGSAPDDGALRSWVTAASERCHRLPASIADEEASLLEVLGIAVHAIDLAEARPGMTAGVYGCGPVGLVLVRALRAAGLEVAVATDRLAHRVAAARASGAASAIEVGTGPDPAAAIPVDVAFECSGDDAALDTAVAAVRPGGRVLIVGIPDGDRSSFRAFVARRKELALQLVRRMEEPDLPRAIGLVASGVVTLDGLVTDRYPLEDVRAAFERLVAREGLKIVVRPGRRA